MAKLEYPAKKKSKKRSHAKCEEDNDEKISSKNIDFDNGHAKHPIEKANDIVKPKTEETAVLQNRVQGKKRTQLDADDKMHRKRGKHRADLDDEDDCDNSKLNEEEYNSRKILMENLSTIRQKKKLVHQQLQKQQKDLIAEREVQRNEQYLRQWKDCRNKWKFEKLRQISVERMMFSKLNNDIWPIALEYLSASHGAAKKRILQMATAVIDKTDSLCESNSVNDANESMESLKYQRARDLMQALN